MNEIPFRPFTITMSDGRQYPVPNHDGASVGQFAVMIAIGLDEHEFAQRWVHCAYLHVTRLEDTKPPAKRRRKPAKT
jgi:hypothetical protein